MNDLPWAKLFGRRCPARLSRVDSPVYYGRCELGPHSNEVDHALERGMINIRWHTHLDVEETAMSELVVRQAIERRRDVSD